MSRGVDLLVATPGRLIDLIEQRYVNLSMLEILVLDEADQMLDLCFIHALRRIVTLLPKQRQSLFFSVTMPKTIRTQTGRAHVCTPVTNAHLVSRLLLVKKKANLNALASEIAHIPDLALLLS